MRLDHERKPPIGGKLDFRASLAACAALAAGAERQVGPGAPHAAYYLWAAALKLLGGVATVEYLALSQRDAELSACLENLEEQEQGAVPFPVRLGVEVNDGALDVMFTQIQTERSVNAIQLKWLDKPTALQTALAA